MVNIIVWLKVDNGGKRRLEPQKWICNNRIEATAGNSWYLGHFGKYESFSTLAGATRREPDGHTQENPA